MPKPAHLLLLLSLLLGSSFCLADNNSQAQQQSHQHEKNQQKVDQLQQPLYTPFVERYVLDELKQLRIDMANQRIEINQQITDRQLDSVDKGVTYATNTITYFFYLIAGVSSILVVVGWTSIREIKERMRNLADSEIGKLIDTYETRLREIEKQLSQKTRHIDQNREEIERTQEIHSLWLRAAQENAAANKLPIYDRILQLKPDDCEALTYKADAVLELSEPQWAINLCQQALRQDADNAHAFYQLACAYTCLEQKDEALHYLQETLSRADSYREAIAADPALAPLQELPSFKQLLHPHTELKDSSQQKPPGQHPSPQKPST